jgi:transposase
MSNFTLPLGIDSLKITAQTVDTQGNIIFDVESTATSTPCHKCGKSTAKKYSHGEIITVRHLPILDQPVYLRIRVMRYQCTSCDDHPTTSEKYDWMERKAKTTKALDSYINRQIIHSTVEDVSKKERIHYDIVESALNRMVDTAVDWANYNDLSTMGIDEIALRKGNKDYVTIVSSKDKTGSLSVIAVLPDRLKETVKAFLESIPDHLKRTVKAICTDMYDGFVNAAAEVFGDRVVVVDRYHVSKLYREPLDALRIKEMQRLKASLPHEEYAKLEGMMWILRKQHECLSKAEKAQMALFYKHSPKIKEAHRHAIRLTHIFNAHHNRKAALTRLNRWIEAVEISGVTIFNGFIKTLVKYKTNILNYFKNRKNSGFVEGLNNKIKVLKRRCYGMFKPESLFQRLFLDLRGYKAFA